jgi:hypothetical protein
MLLDFHHVEPSTGESQCFIHEERDRRALLHNTAGLHDGLARLKQLSFAKPLHGGANWPGRAKEGVMRSDWTSRSGANARRPNIRLQADLGLGPWQLLGPPGPVLLQLNWTAQNWIDAVNGAYEQYVLLAVQAWIDKAYLGNSTFYDTVGHFMPGALRCDHRFLEADVTWAFSQNGFPPGVASAFGQGTRESWDAWAAGWSKTEVIFHEWDVERPPFPKPLHDSADVTTFPFPLKFGNGAENALEEDAIIDAIRRHLSPDLATQFAANEGMRQYAARFSAAFRSWNSAATLYNVKGSGSWVQDGATQSWVLSGSVSGDKVFKPSPWDALLGPRFNNQFGK